MYLMASPTVWIFSASSSLISILNASSSAMTNSTVSSESAPRSFTNEASIVTSSGSTPSCSTMMPLTLSSMLCAICFPPCGTCSDALACVHPARMPGGYRGGTLIIVRRPLHVKTAADVQDLAGDVGGAGTEEKRDTRRHVRGCSQPAQGDESRHPVARLLLKRLGHLGVDEPRGHRVHGDRARRHFPGQRLGEPEETGLGRAIVGLTRVPHEPDDRADVDDTAVARPHHRRQHGARRLERAREIDRENAVPVLAFHPEQQSVDRDPGVVHQVVDPAERLQGLRGPGGYRRRVHEVHRDGAAADTLSLAFRRHLLQVVPFPAAQHEIRAPGRQREGDAPADPARGPGDEAHPPLQLARIHVVPPGPAAMADQAPSRVAGSSTFRTLMPGTIRFARPDSTRPGPTSTMSSDPMSCILRTLSTQRTGIVTCSTSAARSASARVSGRAPTFRTTGTRASRSGSAARSTARRSAAVATRPLAKAALPGGTTAFLAPG